MGPRPLRRWSELRSVLLGMFTGNLGPLKANLVDEKVAILSQEAMYADKS